MEFKLWFEEEYKGEHEAPDKENGKPLWNLNGIYPEDIYGHDAVRLYGDGNPYDAYSISIIQRAKGRPKMSVTVYRAVPKILNQQDKINDYEQQLRHILRTGKIPNHVKTHLNKSQYYGYAREVLDKLKMQPIIKEQRIKIESGNWVSISRDYAIEHGKSNLNNQYRLISKTVFASTLYTDGNNIHEWGYVTG